VESILFIAGWLFVVTHLDTLFVLGAFCADAEYQPWEVFVGHAVSAVLVLCGAVVGAIVAAELLEEWTFLLGLVPIAIGAVALVRRHSGTAMSETRTLPNATGRIGVVLAAGIGLGGENLAVFIPFFAGLETTALATVVLAYLVGAVLVFLAAFAFVHRFVAGIPAWLERWFVPAVLIFVGGYVFVTGLLVT